MTLVSKDEQGVESSIAAHKCVLSISSGYLENVINLPDNHNHNLQLDLSCMADPTSINQLVDFAYTGKISFTAVDFDRLATAIEKLQIRNIDEVSINKIREDINLSNSKKASSEVEPSISPTSPQPTTVAPRMQQIMLSPSHMTHSTHNHSHSQPKVQSGLGNLSTKNRLGDRFSGSKCRQVSGQRFSGPNFRQESRTGF